MGDVDSSMAFTGISQSSLSRVKEKKEQILQKKISKTQQTVKWILLWGEKKTTRFNTHMSF